MFDNFRSHHIVCPSLNTVFLQLNKVLAYLGTLPNIMSFSEWAPRDPTVPVPKFKCSFLISFVIGVILQEATRLIGSQVRWNKRDGWLAMSLLLCGDASEAAVERRKNTN